MALTGKVHLGVAGTKAKCQLVTLLDFVFTIDPRTVIGTPQTTGTKMAESCRKIRDLGVGKAIADRPY